MKSKTLNYKKVLDSTLVSFLCYTTLLGFIFVLSSFIISSTLQDISNLFLTIILSLIGAILIYHFLHFICKSSTIEALKKIKLDIEGTKIFIKKMNLFFVICVILSVLLCTSYLVMYSFMYANAINSVYNEYAFISPNLANKLVHAISEQYYDSINHKLFSTLITEFSLVISFFSLIPYQKKILEKFNK